MTPGVPGGVRHSSFVSETTVTGAQSTPEIATLVPADHRVPLPVTVILVPPLVAPHVGETTNAS